MISRLKKSRSITDRLQKPCTHLILRVGTGDLGISAEALGEVAGAAALPTGDGESTLAMVLAGDIMECGVPAWKEQDV